MTTYASATVSLDESEFQLIRNALEAFLMAFGHDEADVVRDLQRLLAKLTAAHEALTSVND